MEAAPSRQDAGSGPGLRPACLSRTYGPPCSNICSFQVEHLPGVSFTAYALGDGTLVVQQVRLGP